MDFINGCLFVGEHGLFQVFCNFNVICINEVRHIKEGEVKPVEAVCSTPDGFIVYQIEEQYYYHHHFTLLNF